MRKKHIFTILGSCLSAVLTLGFSACSIGGNPLAPDTGANGATLNVKSGNQAIVREVSSLKEGSFLGKTYQAPVFSESYQALRLPVYQNGAVTDNANAAIGEYTAYKGGWLSHTTEFALHYVFTDEDGNTLANVDNSANPATYTLNTDFALKTPACETAGYVLEGWYLDQAHTQEIKMLDGKTLWANHHGAASVYGKWIQAQQDAVSFDFGNAETGYSFSHENVFVVENRVFKISDYTTLAELTTTGAAYKTDFGKQYYFDGWYYNGEKIETLTVTGDLTLTAKWVKKVTVTVEVNSFTNWLG